MSTAILAAQAADPCTFFVKAEEETGEFIGVIMCRVLSGAILTLPATFVKETYRDASAEQAMIMECLAYAKKLGVIRSYVGCEDGNGDRMRQALHDCGFKVMTIHDDSPPTGIIEKINKKMKELGFDVSGEPLAYTEKDGELVEAGHGNNKRYTMVLDLFGEEESFNRMNEWASKNLFTGKKVTGDNLTVASMMFQRYGVS